MTPSRNHCTHLSTPVVDSIASVHSETSSHRMSIFVMRCDISMQVTYPGLKVTLTPPPPLPYTHTHTHTHTHTSPADSGFILWYILYNQWCFSLPWINLPISTQQFKYLPTPRIWVWTDVLCLIIMISWCKSCLFFLSWWHAKLMMLADIMKDGEEIKLEQCTIFLSSA